jgi:hypothetical protein
VDQRAALEAFCDLEHYLASGAEAHRGLSEIEREAETRGREVVRRSLQAHLDARGDGDVGDALVVEGPDGPRGGKPQASPHPQPGHHLR